MKQAVMYLGPNRPYGLPLQNRMILRGDPVAAFPELAKYMDENMAMLFAPVSELATARAQIKRYGTPLHLAYQKVQKAVLEFKAETGPKEEAE